MLLLLVKTRNAGRHDGFQDGGRVRVFDSQNSLYQRKHLKIYYKCHRTNSSVTNTHYPTILLFNCLHINEISKYGTNVEWRNYLL